MARTPKTTEAKNVKSVQVSTSISPELFEALEDYRWSQRLEKSDVLRVALQEYAVNHDLQVAAEAPEAAAE